MASNAKHLSDATVLLSQLLSQPQATLLALSLGQKGDQSLCDLPTVMFEQSGLVPIKWGQRLQLTMALVLI